MQRTAEDISGMRRRVVVLAALALVACSSNTSFEPPGPAMGGRLSARPGAPAGALEPGRHPLGLGGARDGYLYIPETVEPGVPAPLMVAFHGAGGDADAWGGWTELADARGIVLLAIDSRSGTWDVAISVFGPDVEFIDAALEHTFERVRVDPGRIAFAGFSDGASYALSLGLTNGDLATHIMAFSPGFIRQGEAHGEPAIFVSHGTRDPILPIDGTSRQIVPALREAGYSVTYQEFDGGHEVPLAVAEQALDWFRE